MKTAGRMSLWEIGVKKPSKPSESVLSKRLFHSTPHSRSRSTCSNSLSAPPRSLHSKNAAPLLASVASSEGPVSIDNTPEPRSTISYRNNETNHGPNVSFSSAPGLPKQERVLLVTSSGNDTSSMQESNLTIDLK